MKTFMLLVAVGGIGQSVPAMEGSRLLAGSTCYEITAGGSVCDIVHYNVRGSSSRRCRYR
jgi:hypothetical protein